MTTEQAIKILNKIPLFDMPNVYEFAEALDKAIKALSCSEKPNKSEPLTDKEQRIFLAAMERERKVCKQVDEEWRDCREPYEDSLVMICNEIERKVRGALWGGN